MRRVLERAGWPTRSWQQDGLLVEDAGWRRLRSGADDDAVGRLQAAMDEAVGEVRREEGLEVGLLIKPFHGEDVGATMRRFAGPGGRIVEQAEADVMMRRARAARRAAPAAQAPVCELAALTAEAEGAETAAAAAEEEALFRESERMDAVARGEAAEAECRRQWTMVVEQMETGEAEAGAAAEAAFEMPDGRDATLLVDEDAGEEIEAEARGRGHECEATMGEASDGDYVGGESEAGGETGASEGVEAMDEDEGGAAAMGEATAMEVDGGEETGGESEMMSSQGSASSGASGRGKRVRGGTGNRSARRTGDQRNALGTAARACGRAATVGPGGVHPFRS